MNILNESADLFAAEFPWASEAASAEAHATAKAKVTRRKSRVKTRRLKSEAHIAEILPALENGYSYHVMSQGDVDSLTFLSHLLKTRRLDYCLLSTWCMAMADVEQMAAWLKDGQIGRLDAYVGEIFPNQYVDEFVALCDAVRQTGGRVAVFRNHSKIFAGTGPDGAFAIESSANINTNPRAEQTAIHMSQDLFDHYKAFFDGITPFNKDFPDWTPIAA